MLENLLLTDIMANCKRDDLQRATEHALLVSLAGAPDAGFHPRRAVAVALMRVAALIDSNVAARGTTAAAH
jgi:hypothetical protein